MKIHKSIVLISSTVRDFNIMQRSCFKFLLGRKASVEAKFEHSQKHYYEGLMQPFCDKLVFRTKIYRNFRLLS